MKPLGMDYTTYKKLRAYCMQDLRQYILIPEYDTTFQLHAKLAGDAELGRIWREMEIAHSLFQSIDLTPREAAASHLLAVISNHRAITWQREPRPPSGNKPAPPLENTEADALVRQTGESVKDYAVFLPKAERKRFLQLAAPDKDKETSEGEPKQLKPQDDKPEADWIKKAQTKASEIYKREKEAGCDPSNQEIAKIIEKEFATEGVRTVKKKRLNADYILRHGMEDWERPKT